MLVRDASEKGPGEWDWAFPILVAGGEAAFCVQEFEGHHSRFSMATIRRRGQAGMAYLLAKQRLDPVLSADEMATVTDAFLARFIPQLLGEGQYQSCALWVKLLVPPQAGVRAGELLRRTVVQHAE